MLVSFMSRQYHSINIPRHMSQDISVYVTVSTIRSLHVGDGKVYKLY